MTAGPPPLDRFADPDVGLEVPVPRGWVAAATDDFPLLILAPEDDGFRANVGVLVGVLVPSTPEAFESRVAATKAERAARLPGFHVVAERTGPQAGNPGWQLRATWDMDGRTLTQVTQVFVAPPARLYEVTATCLQQAEQAYLPVFRSMLDSWVVLPVQPGSDEQQPDPAD